MNKHLAGVLVAALLAGAAASAVAQNTAIVNGKPIPESRFKALQAQIEETSKRTGKPISPEIAQQLRQEVIDREIFAQAALQAGVDRSQKYHDAVDLMRQSVLINMYFQDWIEKNPVTDAQIKAEYDNFVKEMIANTGGKDYKASHILVDKEATANDILSKLKAGATFADLAKKYSQDPGSAANGGDLGWSNAKSFDPDFANALVKLSKGETTSKPVKSTYGWHIIYLEDTREVKPQKPPTLDQIRPQIIKELATQKLAAYQKSLIDSAKVK